jgi:RNA polymerase sigma-70 factor (ECF subfamily)
MFDAHRASIWSYCFRRLPGDDVQDAVADVFLHAWRRIDQAPDGDGRLLWLYGIARNVVRNARRSGTRRRRLRDRARALAGSESDDPAAQVVRRAEDQELLQAVDRLDPLARELLRLRTWEELTLAEIATVTGMSTRAVESRLARIRKRLAVMLREQPLLGPRRAGDRVLEEWRHS